MLAQIMKWLSVSFIAFMLVAHVPSGVGAEDEEPSDGEGGEENGAADRETVGVDGEDGGELVTDPYASTESTDTAVSVTVTSMSWEMKKEGDKMVDQRLSEGTTTGDVDHCAYAVVLYYDDGSVTYEDFVAGPVEEDYEGYGSFYFGGKDDKDDWSSWKLEYNVEYDYRESEEEDGEEDDVGIEELVFYVRAFGNASDENTFFQTSISKSVSADGDSLKTVDEKEEDDEDDDEGIPGFGAALLLVALGAIGAVMILVRRKR
jgi:hypothetical protein